MRNCKIIIQDEKKEYYGAYQDEDGLIIDIHDYLPNGVFKNECFPQRKSILVKDLKEYVFCFFMLSIKAACTIKQSICHISN